MEYRKATIDDVSLLAQFNKQKIQDEGHRNPMTVPELENRMQGWLMGETYTAILFFQEHTPVAYAVYRDDGDFIYIRQFFVSREHRRQGIGRLAMTLLLSDILPADKMVRLDVLINNTNARAFWQSVGFGDYCITMELHRG